MGTNEKYNAMLPPLITLIRKTHAAAFNTAAFIKGEMNLNLIVPSSKSRSRLRGLS